MRYPLLAGVLSLAIGVASDGKTETFDQAGNSWTVTRFSDVLAAPGSKFAREPLIPATGVPDTTPPLPINAFGDKEGVYREVAGAVTDSYALTADVPRSVRRDGAIRGYVAIGNPDPFGSQGVGFVLRATVTSPGRVDGYSAQINHNGGGMALFSISRIRNGLITVADLLAQGTFPVDLAQENYLIEFHAKDDLFVARVSRVRVVGGRVLHSPILLSVPGGPPSELLIAEDATFPSGRAGVWGFARGGNSVFFDDVRVGPAFQR